MLKHHKLTTLSKTLLTLSSVLLLGMSFDAGADQGYRPATISNTTKLSDFSAFLSAPYQEVYREVKLSPSSNSGSSPTGEKKKISYQDVYYGLDSQPPSKRSKEGFAKLFTNYLNLNPFNEQFHNFYEFYQGGPSAQSVRSKMFSNPYYLGEKATIDPVTQTLVNNKHAKAIYDLAGDSAKVLVVERNYSDFLSRNNSSVEVETLPGVEASDFSASSYGPLTHGDYVVQNLVGQWNDSLRSKAGASLTPGADHNGLLSQGGKVKVLTFYQGEALDFASNPQKAPPQFALMYSPKELNQGAVPYYRVTLEPSFLSSLQNGYNIVNLSWNAEFSQSTLKEMVDYSEQNGFMNPERASEARDLLQASGEDFIANAFAIYTEEDFLNRQVATPGLLPAFQQTIDRDYDPLYIQATGNEAPSISGTLIELKLLRDQENYSNSLFKHYIGVSAKGSYASSCSLLKYNCISGPDKVAGITNRESSNGNVAANSYQEKEGTSFATPYVAATAAMVRQVFPFMSNADVQLTVLGTASPLNEEGEALDKVALYGDENYFHKRVSARYGWGMVNPLAAANGPSDIPYGRKLVLDLTKNNPNASAQQMWTFSNFLYGNGSLELKTSKDVGETPLLNLASSADLAEIILGKNTRLNIDGLPPTTREYHPQMLTVREGAVLSGNGYLGTPILEANALLVARSLLVDDKDLVYFSKDFTTKDKTSAYYKANPKFQQFLANLPRVRNLYFEGGFLMLDLNYPLMVTQDYDPQLLSKKKEETKVQTAVTKDYEDKVYTDSEYQGNPNIPKILAADKTASPNSLSSNVNWENAKIILRPGKGSREGNYFVGMGLITQAPIELKQATFQAVNSLFEVGEKDVIENIASRHFNFSPKDNAEDAEKSANQGYSPGHIYYFGLKLKDVEQAVKTLLPSKGDFEYDDGLLYGSKNLKTIIASDGSLANKVLNSNDAEIEQTSYALSGVEYNQFRQRALIANLHSADRNLFSLFHTPVNQKTGYNLSYQGSIADGREKDFSSLSHLTLSKWDADRRWNAGLVFASNRFSSANTNLDSTFSGQGLFFNYAQDLELGKDNSQTAVFDYLTLAGGVRYNYFSGTVARQGSLAGSSFRLDTPYQVTVFSADTVVAFPFFDEERTYMIRPYLGVNLSYNHAPSRTEKIADYSLNYNQYSTSNLGFKGGVNAKLKVSTYELFLDYALDYLASAEAKGSLVDSDGKVLSMHYASGSRNFSHFSEFGLRKATKDWEFEVYGQGSYKNYFSKGLGLKLTYKF